MKVVSLPRGAGKTSAAIMESYKTGRYILVMNKMQARMVFDRAQQLGLNIPFPITLHECRNSQGLNIEEVIVDEAGMVLETLLDKKVSMVTITEVSE